MNPYNYSCSISVGMTRPILRFKDMAAANTRWRGSPSYPSSLGQLPAPLLGGRGRSSLVPVRYLRYGQARRALPRRCDSLSRLTCIWLDSRIQSGSKSREPSHSSIQLSRMHPPLGVRQQSALSTRYTSTQTSAKGGTRADGSGVEVTNSPACRTR